MKGQSIVSNLSVPQGDSKKFTKGLKLLLSHLQKKKAHKAVQKLTAHSGSITKELVEEIAGCLEHSNPWVRMAAAECLGAAGRKEAVRPLCSMLSDYFVIVRMETARSLGDLLANSAKSPSLLVHRLRDPNFLVRIEVAEALGKIGDSNALPALWSHIHDPSPLVRSYIAAAIGVLGSEKDAQKLRQKISKVMKDEEKLGYYTALADLGDKKMLRHLLTLLRSKDYRVRCATAKTICDFCNSSANAPQILGALNMALKTEQTIGAKSIFQHCIRTIKKRFNKSRKEKKR